MPTDKHPIGTTYLADGDDGRTSIGGGGARRRRPLAFTATRCLRFAPHHRERRSRAIDAPERAEDAAVVPITIRVAPSVKGRLKSMVLVIDKNPSPVAATFTFGPAAGEGGGERRMSTRVRIDTYSYVHAVVETADGTLHMAKAFVKASGGCAAPAPKDADGDLADIGKTIVKSF